MFTVNFVRLLPVKSSRAKAIIAQIAAAIRSGFHTISGFRHSQAREDI